MAETPIYNLPYPVSSDTPTIPLHFKSLADRLEAVLGQVESGADNNTTYTISATGDTSPFSINLVGSDLTTDSVTLSAGSNITLTRVSNNIEIASTFGGSIDSLSDVAITSPAANSFLIYSGGSWVDSDRTLSLGGNIITGGAFTLSGAFTTTLNVTANTEVTLPTSGTLATTALATSTVPGLVELFSDTQQTVAANSVSSTASRTYGIQLNSSGQMVVNVPWTDTDTNTTYTAGSGLQLNTTEFSLNASLDNLTDVVITGTPTVGQVLKFNGTSWVNDTDATGGSGGSTTLDGLTDVSVSGALDNQVLTYDSDTSTWIAASVSGSGVDTNDYPTAVTISGGTTLGPVIDLTMNSGSAVDVTSATIPSASDSVSGVVTTAAQTFAGIKTFTSNVNVTGIDTNVTSGTFSIVNSGLTGNLNIGGAVTGNITLGSSSSTVIISGNLTVNGTTTNINTTNLVVEDKNIVLGDVATPSNTTADGGGITLKGATDKTFNWINSTSAWTSSEDIDLASGKVLKIAGTQVLSATNFTGISAKATNLTGATTNTIPYQSGSETTSYITAPTTGNTYLRWTGTAFEWAAVSGGGGSTVLGTTTSTAEGAMAWDASYHHAYIGDGTNLMLVPTFRVNTTAKTASYILVAEDANTLIQINSSTSKTITIPHETNTVGSALPVNFPIGTQIHLVGIGTGQVSITNVSGVTLRYTPSNILRTQNSSATIIKIATNTWLLVGDLAE